MTALLALNNDATRTRRGAIDDDEPGEMVGTISELWRFPVKSMQGERLDEAIVGEAGIIGDRAYAVVDRVTGKVASAKHPKLWPELLSCQATFTEPPRLGEELPSVHLDLADGTSVMSDADDVDAVLDRGSSAARSSSPAVHQAISRSTNTTRTSKISTPKATVTR